MLKSLQFLIVFSLAFTLGSQAQTVSLKPDFGTNGFTLTNIETIGTVTNDQEVHSFIVQPDGKIIFAGHSAGRGILMRLNDNGTTDLSFGVNGIAVAYAGPIQKAVLQPDGKIVVGIGSYVTQFTLLRFNADGTPDVGFGTGGIVGIQVGLNTSSLSDIVLQPDGKIIAAGIADYYDAGAGFNRSDFGVLRLNADGTPDATFDGDGKRLVPVSSADDGASAVALDFSDPLYTTGKIVLGGYAFPNIASARLLPDGSLDAGFDGDGILVESFGANAYINDLKVLNDGRIIAGGAIFTGTGNDLTLIRYNVNGTRDNSFSGDGLVRNPSGDGNTKSPVMALQLLAGDKLIVASDRIQGGIPFVLSQYNADGSLDGTLDGDGILLSNFNSNFDQVYDLAIDNAGKYLIGGLSKTNTNIESLAINRYNINGSLDATFDGDGKYIYNLPSSADRANAVALQTDGKIIAAGYTFKFSAAGGFPQRDFAVVRYDINGMLDPGFGTGGIVKTDIGSSTSDEASAILIQPDGKIIVAGNGGVGYAVARYNTNGTPDNTFDGDGKISFSAGSLSDIALTSTGQIIVSYRGSSGGNDNVGVIRFNTNGSFDNSFGSGGLGLYTSNDTDESFDMVLRSDGKIVLSGIFNGQGGVLQFTANGIIDGSFGSSGLVTFTIAGYTPNFTEVTTDANGNILVGGNVYTPSGTTLALARITPAGALDGTFGSGGKVNTNLTPSTEETIISLFPQTDGTIIAGGNLRQSPDDRNFFVIRYTASGAIDGTFNNNTGLFTKDLNIGSLDYINQYVQSGNALYGAGYMRTEKQDDVLILAVNLSGSALPVTMLDFTGTIINNNVLLKWSTVFEQNNKGFEIHRSLDGSRFEKIGFVNGTGNSTSKQSYNYTDNAMSTGKIFYKLKQVDADGSGKWSNVVSVQFSKNASISVYPNPAHSYFTLSGTSTIKLIELFDVGGKKIKTFQPLNQNKYDVQELQQGVYFIRITAVDETYLLKLNKK